MEVALVIVTFALAVITFFYLRETRQIRKTAERSFITETSPKVFLENITSVPRLNQPKKEIEVTAVFLIKNVGRTEAKNFVAEYTLSSGNMKIGGKIGPVPYIFPSQGVRYETKMLGLGLNDQQLAMAQEAMATQKSFIIPVSTVPPILLDLTISYLDQQGEEQRLPYKCQYTLHNNAWVFVTDS